MDWSSDVRASTFISVRIFWPRIGSWVMMVKEISSMFCWKRFRTLDGKSDTTSQYHEAWI